MRKRIIAVLIVLACVFTVSSCESFFDKQGTYQFYYALNYSLTDEKTEFPAIKEYFSSVVDFDNYITITDKKSAAVTQALDKFNTGISGVDGAKVLSMISGDEAVQLCMLMVEKEGYSVVNYVTWSHQYDSQNQ